MLILNFKLWLENIQQSIVSFDFDSTLTQPEYDHDNELWEPGTGPYEKNINLINDYHHKGYKIFIVSSRPNSTKKEIEYFVKTHHLPISEIYCTNGEKGFTLARLGVSIHYDDQPQQHEDPNHLYKGKWIVVPHPAD